MKGVELIKAAVADVEMLRPQYPGLIIVWSELLHGNSGKEQGIALNE